VHFDDVFNRQKTRTVKANWDTDVTVQLRNVAYKNSVKIIQNFTDQKGGSGRTVAPPEYATVVTIIFYLSSLLFY